MNITFDEKNRVFKIDTANTSYIFAVVDTEGFLGHIYYGPYIDSSDVTYVLRTEEYPFVPSVYAREKSPFLDRFLHEFSGNGSGDFRESGIRVKDPKGHSVVALQYKGYRIIDDKPALPKMPSTFARDGKVKTLMVETYDPVIKLEVVFSYSIFEDSDAIIRTVKVTNKSEEIIHLTKIYPVCFDMEDEGYKMLTLHGGWAKERQIEVRDIAHGRTNIGTYCGKSSHQEHPFFALLGPDTNDDQGKVYGFNFVYSGNFIGQVEKNQFDCLRVSMGINPENFDFCLESQEEFVSPEVVSIYSNDGLGKMTREFHDLYRNHLIRSEYLYKDRPILINNWEATYFDFDTDKLISIAKEAAKYGIEMLVMDDGWFGKRNSDELSLGDWDVNEEKIKGGLKYLVDEVNKAGLKFGIWFEPEMVSLDSNLYREHPDWIISVPDREPAQSRRQFVLDLTRREVIEHVYESVAKILRSANIEYVKWDMNRQISDLGSYGLDVERQGEICHKFVLGVYELQERLLQEFPHLLLENCSSGGARFDPGMLYYSPQIWTSDDTDAIERLGIQEGTALIYPLSTLGAHVSDCPNHVLGRNVPFETRGHVAMAGTFGYELDVTKIPMEDRLQIPKQVEMYHKYHKLVSSGDYYRILSYKSNGLNDAYIIVSKDKSEALLTYVQVINRPNRLSRILKLKGLDGSKIYKVEDSDKKYKGDVLMNIGLPIENLNGDFSSVMIHLYAE